jgi:hypothetical protein
MNKTKKYGRPLSEYPRIRPVLKNEGTKPSGEYAIVDGKKEKKKGKLQDLINSL